jgi:hypothetical protein
MTKLIVLDLSIVPNLWNIYFGNIRMFGYTYQWVFFMVR